MRASPKGAMKLTRVRAGLALLLLYAAVSDARWSYRAVRGWIDSRHEDSISRDGRRYREIRRVLPARGVVGYVGSAQPDSFTTEDFRRFLLAEYALAPLILINDTTPDLIVGNFPPDSVPSGPPLPGLHVVRDFGQGVWLVRKGRR
jgi:hypothetical protein